MAALLRCANLSAVSSRQRFSIRLKHMYTFIHSLDEEKYLEWESILEPMASVVKLVLI